MAINLETLIPYEKMIKAPGDVFDLIDEHGQVVLLRNNSPAYIIIKAEMAAEMLTPQEHDTSIKAEYTLQEAMKLVLLGAEDNQMHAAELADAIFQDGLYFKKDGTKAEYTQIRARCGHYPDMFEALPGNIIRLKIENGPVSRAGEGDSMQGISKFAGLERFLKAQDSKILSLSFDKIEEITGEKLYPSAHKYIQYWHPSKTHVLPNLILECGYKITNVDLTNKTIELRRTQI